MTLPIPTLPERMRQIEARIVDGLTGPEVSEPVLSDVCDMLCAPITLQSDIFEQVAVARGCHVAAQELHWQGNHSLADGYAAIGQDILAKTIAVIAQFVALDRHLSGVTTH
jgi:hypothetical protein